MCRYLDYMCVQYTQFLTQFNEKCTPIARGLGVQGCSFWGKARKGRYSSLCGNNVDYSRTNLKLSPKGQNCLAMLRMVV